MKVKKHRPHRADFPHEHWFVKGYDGEQCVYCGQPPEDAKEEAPDEDSGPSGGLGTGAPVQG